MKKALEWGIYNPQENLPIGSWKGPECPSGRPVDRPANGQKKPSGRPCQIQRAIALWPVDRPVDRAKAHGRPPPPESGVTSVGRLHGRPAEPTWPLCTSRVLAQRPITLVLMMINS